MVYVNAQHKTWIFLHSKQILATLVMMELDIRYNISNTQKLDTRFKPQITEKNVMKAVLMNYTVQFRIYFLPDIKILFSIFNFFSKNPFFIFVITTNHALNQTL